MPRLEFAEFARGVRCWGMSGVEDHRVHRLVEIEKQIPFLHGSCQLLAERVRLIQELAFERHRNIVQRILPSSFSHSDDLGMKVENLHKFVSLLKKEPKNLRLIQAFKSLPSDVKNLFYWAIWVKEGAPEEQDYGEKRLLSDLSLLNQNSLPIVHVNGGSLAEQEVARLECLLFNSSSSNVGVSQKVKELEEMERLTLLSQSASLAQLNAVLNAVSESARKMFDEVGKETLQIVALRSDSRHLYQFRGAHPEMAGTRFEVFAPSARMVYLKLTAFGKIEHEISMQRNALGLWQAFTPHAAKGRTYRFTIQDCHGEYKERTDPFSFAIIEQDGIAESVVCEMDAFVWNDAHWMHQRKEGHPLSKPLSIYEMNVDCWKKDHGRTLSFEELAHHIVSYHRQVPFTHVELYGVLDNKHDFSWGYQPDHFFAPNRRLGGLDGFKYLVDLLHQNEIGVILDWIPAHYKHEHAGDLSQSLHDYDGTNLFAAENSPWGTVYFDYSKEETRRLMLASALFWLEKMHVDGLRVDAVSPMVHRNHKIMWDAIDFLKTLNCLVHEKYPGVLMIAEETDGFARVTYPVEKDGLGFDVKCGVHLQYRMRSYFRTPYEYRSYSEHHFDELIFNLNEVGHQERWMLAHSHDDAAAGSSHSHSSLYRSIPTEDSWRKFADMRLFHAWNLFSPGAGHLMHMGDEIGQNWPWNQRLLAFEGAVQWHLLDEQNSEHSLRRALLQYVGDAHRLYRSKPAFWKHAEWGYRPISNYSPHCVVGYHRLDFEGGRLALFYNFSIEGYQEYDFLMPAHPQDSELAYVRGAREIFNSDRMEYGGTGNFKNSTARLIRNGSGELTHFRFAMPPLSVLVFEETWEEI